MLMDRCRARNKMSFRHLLYSILIPDASRAFQARMHPAINFPMSMSGHPIGKGDVYLPPGKPVGMKDA